MNNKIKNFKEEISFTKERKADIDAKEEKSEEANETIKEKMNMENEKVRAILEKHNIKIENIVSSFVVDKEIDKDGLEGADVEINKKAEIIWIRFKKPEDDEFNELENVEGKLYIPKENNNKELILFTPGFPGGNAGRFEKIYANSFIDNGYNFFTIRHNGASLDEEKAGDIMNCGKRFELASELGEEYIGSEGKTAYSPSDVINEPLTPLLAMHKNFNKVHLMGQSLGVAASYNAISKLKKHTEIINKISRVIGIAGYVGSGGGEDDIWDGMKIPMKDLIKYQREHIKKVGTNALFNEEEISKVAEANSKMEVPEHISNILVYTPNDPLLSGPDKSKDDYINNYGPNVKRKLIIKDETNLDKPKQHSMLWIEPDNLLRALKAGISNQGPHFIRIPKSKEKGLLEKG